VYVEGGTIEEKQKEQRSVIKARIAVGRVINERRVIKASLGYAPARIPEEGTNSPLPPLLCLLCL